MDNIAKTLILIVSTMVVLSGCTKKKEDKAFRVFNEGVALSLEAGELARTGNINKARELNAQAIEKYKETLSIDTSHGIARSALGHSYYLQREFAEGIYWFEQANRLDTPMATNFRELGLCKINLGRIREGMSDIDKAFTLDGGTDVRKTTILDMVDIGNLAFEYGQNYETEGNKETALSYKRFAIGVLMAASTIDTTHKDIAATIARYAEALGDTVTMLKYQKIAGY